MVTAVAIDEETTGRVSIQMTWWIRLVPARPPLTPGREQRKANVAIFRPLSGHEDVPAGWEGDATRRSMDMDKPLYLSETGLPRIRITHAAEAASGGQSSTIGLDGVIAKRRVSDEEA